MSNEKEKPLVDAERAYAALLVALRGEGMSERQEAVKALARLGGMRAIEPLLVTLANDHEFVAAQAAEALAAIGDARTVAPLIDYCLRYQPEGNYRNNPDAPYEERRRMRDWVRPLAALVERVAADIEPEDLRRLAGLQDQEFYLHVDYDTPGYGSGSDDFVIKLDFSRVRDLAVAEQRGRTK